MMANNPRMAALAGRQMNEVQKAAAAQLISGPRKGVKGPFISLLRSPELMDRLQKVGEFLRFHTSLSARASEFATLVVSRAWSQQFEWFTHVPLAIRAGTLPATLADLREGRRPRTMNAEEAVVYDFTDELLAKHGVCEATYREAVDSFGEQGVVELASLVGYFVLVSMVLNVTHTREEPDERIEPLRPYPR